LTDIKINEGGVRKGSVSFPLEPPIPNPAREQAAT